MRRFFFKVFVFLAIPFTMLNILAKPLMALVTFRAWETLTPYDRTAFAEPFYPNQRLTMVEEGDLGHDTQYAVAKDVVFVTDKYGFRYSGAEQDHYSIVIVGDSYTVGSGLTQADTLSDALARRLGTSVYPFAPGDLNAFAAQERFIHPYPDIVILQKVERGITPGTCSLPVTLSAALPTPQITGRLVQDIRVHLDLMRRFPMHLDAYLDSVSMRGEHAQELIVDASSGMLFYSPSIPMLPVTLVDAVVEELAACNSWLEDRGIQFVFLPVPDKEDIYYDRIPLEHKPPSGPADRGEYMRRLIVALRERGIAVIDTQSAYEAARAQGKVLYQLDDSHWSRDGVHIAVDRLGEMLSGMEVGE